MSIFITANKIDIQKMNLLTLKKSIAAHWKQFVKDDEKAKEAFYEEGKTQGGLQKVRTSSKRGSKGTVETVASKATNQWTTETSKAVPLLRLVEVVTRTKTKMSHVTTAKKKVITLANAPKKKKNEEFGLFCGVIYQEMLDEEEEKDNKTDKEIWNFVGVAAALEKDLNRIQDKSDDDDSCPSLLMSVPKKNIEDPNLEPDDESMMPELFYSKENASILSIEDQELFNVEEAHYSGINRKNDEDDRKAVTKWLLATGATHQCRNLVE
jgi:hypothetical protein